ncbi:unnamed protein product, partial [Mesorhabditis spiculigera]
MQKFLLSITILLTGTNCLMESSYLSERDGKTRRIPLELADVDSFEQEILSIFGIEEAPEERRTRRDKPLVEEEDPEAATIPPILSHPHAIVIDFMKQLYGRIDDEREMQENKLEKLQNANTIISFGPKKIFSIGDYTGVAFDVLDFPRRTADYVELRIEVVEPFDGQIRISSKKNSELVEYAADIASTSQQLYIFNITQEFGKWIEEEAVPEIFVQFNKEPIGTFAQDFQIFGVASYEGPSARSIPQRKKRSTSKERTIKNVGYMSIGQPTEAGEDEGCHRRGLYVNFNDLGWKDWVIAPEGFEAFLCDGACSFPLHNKMNATNHAIVQTLVNLIHPGRAPSPRCAPSRLSQQKIIFVDNSENVVLKKYQDMIVQECGCQ